MALVERSQDPESHDREPRAHQRELDTPDAKSPGRVPDAPQDDSSESVAQPPADWKGETREVLHCLTEEVQEKLESNSPTIDPIPHIEQPITAERRCPPRQRRLARERPTRPAFTLEQRLLILDAWNRSGLPGTEFAPLVGVAPHTLYCWRRAFEQEGPAGLVQKPRGAPPGSRLPEVTKRAILLMKQDHPEWGCQRISDLLLRGPALGASASAVANVLHEAGYELEEVPTRPHAPEVRRFERARPNQLTTHQQHPPNRRDPTTANRSHPTNREAKQATPEIGEVRVASSRASYVESVSGNHQ